MQKIKYIYIQTNVQGRSVGGSLAVGHIPHLKILRISHRNILTSKRRKQAQKLVQVDALDLPLSYSIILCITL